MSLIDIVVVLLLVGAALYAVSIIPMVGWVKTLINVIVVVVVFLWVLQALGVWHGPNLRLR